MLYDRYIVILFCWWCKIAVQSCALLTDVSAVDWLKSRDRTSVKVPCYCTTKCVVYFIVALCTIQNQLHKLVSLVIGDVVGTPCNRFRDVRTFEFYYGIEHETTAHRVRQCFATFSLKRNPLQQF